MGITGTSYGGYSSILCLLRYPELFHAAVASSSVTKWDHYDTIYTERYMRTPQANPEGYEAGSAMTYAKDLKGWLLLFYGTSDNNVHQANSLELIRALQRAGKYFEVQVGPDRGHSGINFNRSMEFFVERLLMTGPRG
ncbi:MAG: prolyl oligopeptidase family serine peptidase [Proteobacteria bacterium]|nr:prolyl oligopeptidase family serine peptidase [Pseudomonadota bacterium]